MPTFIIVKWDSKFDGDSNHKPASMGVTASYRPSGPDAEANYRQKLGQRFMVESDRAEEGKNYVVNQLPEGYTLWERTRPNNLNHIDRFLYGHPKHQIYRSTNEFAPHFKWLSNDQQGACACCVCSKGQGKGESKSSTLPVTSAAQIFPARRPGRPLSKVRVDEDGVIHTVPLFLTLLQKEGNLERPFRENLSMDWRVETTVAKETREQVSMQRAFVPRVGEVVLWCREIVGELRMETGTGELKVWKDNAFTGHPVWLGGIVTQVPIPEESVWFDDITYDTPKKHNTNSSGFRIECYPNPDQENKAISNQAKYVPMHHIRPMAFFLDVMKGIPNTDWHPTIFNVMKAMSCVSCIDRYKLKGDWPNFHMYHHGIFFGAESYWKDDIVRLVPDTNKGAKPDVITEVMVIKKVVVRTYDVKLDADGRITGNHAERIELVVQGQIYTTNANASKGNVVNVPSDSILHPFGPWYYLEGSNEKNEMQYQHTMGRLYELEAMKRWFPNIAPQAALSAGLGSVTFLRNYVAKAQRQSGNTSFWGEHRADALKLATFNGIDVGKNDLSRDAKTWQKALSVLAAEEKKVVVDLDSGSEEEGDGGKRARMN